MKKIRGQLITSKILILMILLVMVSIIGAGTVSAADGDIIYVNSSHGDDSWDGLSWATAKLSIKNATGTVAENGQVIIGDGMYTGENNRNITLSKNMTITGQSQTGTIINGSNSAIIFHVWPENVNVTIQNLTFTNGGLTDADDDGHTWGGAIANDGYLTVISCTFTNNTAPMGGAIWSDVGLIVNNCTFTGNTATSTKFGGGAILINKGSCTISGCTFTGNTANLGGAILNGGDCTVNFSRFYGNSASTGSAIANAGNQVNAENNWWGSNTNPMNVPNFITSTFIVNGKQFNGGAVDADPWIVMAYEASPTTIQQGATSTLTADFRYNSDGTFLDPTLGHLPDGAPVTFKTNLGNVGSKSIVIGTINGVVTATLRGDEAAGEALTSADLDDQLLSAIVTITQITTGTDPSTDDITDPSSDDTINSPTDNGVTSVNKVNAVTKTIPLRHTGLPLAGFVLAVLAVFGGLVTSKKF